MSYNLDKKEAQDIADKLRKRNNIENVRVAVCRGYSVKFDVMVDGYVAKGAQIHEPREGI